MRRRPNKRSEDVKISISPNCIDDDSVRLVFDTERKSAVLQHQGIQWAVASDDLHQFCKAIVQVFETKGAKT